MTTISPECLDMIALNLVPGMGPVGIKKLLDEVKDPDDIFRMSDTSLLDVLGGKFKETGKIRDVRSSLEYREELEFIRKEGIRVVCAKDDGYPESLRYIYDPPAVLYIWGEVSKCDEFSVAIVGSRRCSLYGMRTAESLAGALAERGITVISGLARGIDSAAHRGAVRAGGRTLAVIGSGIQYLIRSVSRNFAYEIRDKGAVVTEFPFRTLPSKSTFPRRNRIISALAKGVVVVEAAAKSGALITSDFALEQGKEVFAVPGHIDSVTSAGANRLIQNGAKLVASVDDILEELDISGSCGHHGIEKDKSPEKKRRTYLCPEQRKVIDSLSSGDNAHIDDIASETGMNTAELSRVLLALEIKGKIKTLPGSRYAVTPCLK
jgi:DNA processing protein